MNLLNFHFSQVSSPPSAHVFHARISNSHKYSSVCFSLPSSSQRNCACTRLSATFRNRMILYGLRLLTQPQIARLQDHPLWVV